LLIAAVKELPDYSSKFDAVVGALGLIKTQLETGQGDIATKISEVTAEITALIAAVNNGNTDAAMPSPISSKNWKNLKRQSAISTRVAVHKPGWWRKPGWRRKPGWWNRPIHDGVR